MKLGAIRRNAIKDLADAGVENPRVCVDWLLEHVLRMSGAQLIAGSERELTAAQERDVIDGVRRRLAGEPIQYIVGWTEFFGLRILVKSGVLIPRPETEIVVEEVLRATAALPRCRVLDLGTGSGCIALAVKSRRPEATVVACDVSEVALEIARMNAENLGLDIEIRVSDMERGASISPPIEKYDVIVSNPPYIPDSEVGMLPAEVVDYEPREALISGSDPMRFYRAVIDRTWEGVDEGGSMIVEVHSGFAREVVRLLEERALRDIRVRSDLAGLPRVVTAKRPVTVG